jgi:hypothetical protein
MVSGKGPAIEPGRPLERDLRWGSRGTSKCDLRSLRADLTAWRA